MGWLGREGAFFPLAVPAMRDYARGVESTPESEFAAAIAGRDHDVDLFGGAVAIARLGHGSVDAHVIARELDLIAEAVRSRAGDRAGNDVLAGAIGHELFEERGFRGNRENYGDPENSYLDRVIERRLGLPITLSLVYLEVAERVGLECDGIGFPGHFLVRCGGVDGFFVDPFRGGVQPPREELMSQIAGISTGGVSGESFLAAVTRRQILQRMLLNLCGAYQHLSDVPRWIEALGLRLQLEAWNASLYLERGLLRYQQGISELALADLERYVGSGDPDPNPQALSALDELRLRLGRERESR